MGLFKNLPIQIFFCFLSGGTTPLSSSSTSGSSHGGSSKPPPHERKLVRSKTSYGIMGNNRMSKKAMLLRWCQMITQSYEVSEEGV